MSITPKYGTPDGRVFDTPAEAEAHLKNIVVTEEARDFVTNTLGYQKSRATIAMTAIRRWHFRDEEVEEVTDGQ